MRTAISCPDEALEAFMVHCSSRLGESYFRTPRTTIKSFVQLLAVLDQNPSTEWRTLVGEAPVEVDRGPEPDLVEHDGLAGDDEELATFRL